MISTAYTKKGVLEKKVKEFVFIAALTALSADKKHIGAHIRIAAENGATKKEILEVLQCIYPPCGTLKLMNGLEAFEEIFKGK
jgi:alkylhydroperoxidase/carboxymuconolactone decarboxylase family protein YurZ